MAATLPDRSLTLAGAWLALVALATASLVVPLGAAFAISIAAAKAAIVGAIFMDLRRGPRRHLAALAIGAAMFALLVLGVAADVALR